MAVNASLGGGIGSKRKRKQMLVIHLVQLYVLSVPWKIKRVKTWVRLIGSGSFCG